MKLTAQEESHIVWQRIAAKIAQLLSGNDVSAMTLREIGTEVGIDHGNHSHMNRLTAMLWAWGHTIRREAA